MPSISPVPLKRADVAVGVLCGLFLCVYFLWLSGQGLQAGFTHDDLMNLFKGVRQLSFWELVRDNLLFFRFSWALRPFGALYYRVVFSLSGFDPLPFRLSLYVVLLANIFLTYAFARRLTGSREVGAVATLLHCYNGGFWPLYYNTGMCFDIYCFFFYFSAFVYYLRIRRQQGWPRPLEALGFCVLYACALNSKEMAVTLPPLVAAYEWMHHPPASYRPRVLGSWIYRQCWGALLSGLMTVGFLLGRFAGKNSIRHAGGYELNVSLASYLNLFRSNLNELFYQTEWFDAKKSFAFLLVLLLAALVARNRNLTLSWLLLTVGVLPVAFINPRALSAVYIPLVGFAIFAATVLVGIRQVLWRDLGWQRAGQIALFLTVAIGVGRVHARVADRACYPELLADEYNETSAVWEQFRRLHPDIPDNSRILVLKDPLEGQGGMKRWATVFIVMLLYGNDVVVDRVFMMDHTPDRAEMATYDYIFTAEGLRIVEIDPATLGIGFP